MLGFDYAVGVDATTKVVVLGPGGRWSTEPIAASVLARKLGKKAFRRITWREGTSKRLASRFALRRVRLANDDGIPLDQHEPLWLLMEWPFGESEPSAFAVTTLPARMSKKQVVRRYKERYRTEQAYEEMKGELGRPFLHHHPSRHRPSPDRVAASVPRVPSAMFKRQSVSAPP